MSLNHSRTETSGKDLTRDGLLELPDTTLIRTRFPVGILKTMAKFKLLHHTASPLLGVKLKLLNYTASPALASWGPCCFQHRMVFFGFYTSFLTYTV